MICFSRCELRQGVSGMTDEEIRNLLLLAAQVTTTTTPAPTTAAPTLPPLVLNIPNNPCRPLVPCPAGTTPKISAINGRCQCMLQFSFPSLPQLRRRRQALERRRLVRNARRVQNLMYVFFCSRLIRDKNVNKWSKYHCRTDVEIMIKSYLLFSLNFVFNMHIVTFAL